jgi:hypothetical protein
MLKNGLRWVTAIRGALTHLIFVRRHPSCSIGPQRCKHHAACGTFADWLQRARFSASEPLIDAAHRVTVVFGMNKSD